MLIDYIRQVAAAQKLKIIDEGSEFIEFDDMTESDIIEESISPEIEIMAAVKIKFEGDIPESYKVLNLMIGDWVAKNEKMLTKLIHEPLKEYLEKEYPDGDISELDEETSIWLDQLDYMPRVDDKEKTITIEIELILETEEC